MLRTDLHRWAAGLRAHAGDPVVTPPLADDPTNATPFLAHKGRIPRPARPARVDPDAALWWALLDGDRSAAHVVLRDHAPTGPVFPQAPTTAIEVWTERDLSALQALWWLSHERDRMLDAARWHLDNTQPDNATNRPWGIPAFLTIALEDGSHDARLYAETLLHNAVAAGGGSPEPFSAMILLDAADAVDRMRAEM